MKRFWNQMIHWANAKLMFCPRCKQDRPFEKSVWDGAWVCKKCGYRVK